MWSFPSWSVLRKFTGLIGSVVEERKFGIGHLEQTCPVRALTSAHPSSTCVKAELLLLIVYLNDGKGSESILVDQSHEGGA